MITATAKWSKRRHRYVKSKHSINPVKIMFHYKWIRLFLSYNTSHVLIFIIYTTGSLMTRLPTARSWIRLPSRTKCYCIFFSFINIPVTASSLEERLIDENRLTHLMWVTCTPLPTPSGINSNVMFIYMIYTKFTLKQTPFIDYIKGEINRSKAILFI